MEKEKKNHPSVLQKLEDHTDAIRRRGNENPFSKTFTQIKEERRKALVKANSGMFNENYCPGIHATQLPKFETMYKNFLKKGPGMNRVNSTLRKVDKIMKTMEPETLIFDPYSREYHPQKRKTEVSPDTHQVVPHSSYLEKKLYLSDVEMGAIAPKKIWSEVERDVRCKKFDVRSFNEYDEDQPHSNDFNAMYSSFTKDSKYEPPRFEASNRSKISRHASLGGSAQ